MSWVWPSEVPVIYRRVGKREQEERAGQKSPFIKDILKRSPFIKIIAT